MTDQQTPNNPLKVKTGKDHAELVAKYEGEIAQKEQLANEWKQAATNSEDRVLELKKEKERLESERDDWKKEALANRKVYQENKKTHEQTSFVEEFQKLQANKGIITNN